ncbi:MAG: class I SAM-dependent methyltransferase [Candidatus Bathyarchaeia archaeon]
MSRKRYFNEAAETWDEKFGTPELASFLERLVPCFGLKPGDRVLDAGSGTGVLIPYLIKEVGSSGAITAIDYAESMVKICRSKHAQHHNVKVEKHDVEDLPYPRNYFDAVTCFGLFPHLENRERSLSEFNRVLKKRGKLVITHALSSEEIKSQHKDASIAVADDKLPEEEEMYILLKNTGFTDINIKDEPGCYLCTSIKQYDV